MTDQEREEHIKSCGLLLLKAHREGDVEGAKYWLALQNEAIKARTPRQIARMEGCYFVEQGDLAKQASEARGAAGG
ncbi:MULTISPECIES: hypothetical protein [unclassified Variovorax]|uniref:hypothetical protein n=1 Tax=unclassified Variovorax TaxID=663243 RepID=UPI00076DBDA9|nr:MULTISPECIES: hypothetical protein [unclassified Variovorax]KWT89326.1 hypothetical protein APY03_3405 [Variovorax sp. WDL1]PNG56503.1 hypothetical protein CHC07_02920 [Variovorax sp. B4]PNG57926.1 hypothetical protein CHC06_02922 [Variovorax sp. B2]VTV09611.1 hypothetical protein WDL1CHR_00704 [Variovorax sp. WDL1]